MTQFKLIGPIHNQVLGFEISPDERLIALQNSQQVACFPEGRYPSQ